MAIIQKRYAHLNQADSGSLHRKLDATSAYITGSLEAASTLTVRGEAQFDDVAKFGDTTAAIAGLPQAIPNIDLAVSGSAVVGDTFVVLGFVQAGADLEVAGEAHVDGNLEVVGEITGSAAVLFQSTLEVQGNADMRDVLPHANLTYDLGSAANRWDNLFVGSIQALTVSAEVLSASVDADLNGTLHVEGASTFVGAVSLAQLTGSAGARFTGGSVKVEAGEVSASSDLKAGGQLVVAGAADLNGTLDVAGVADLHGNVTAHQELTVNGTGYALYVANSASIQGDVYVKGNLLVDGEQVIIDTTTLRILDKNIELAISASSPVDADGAGLTINGANKHFTWEQNYSANDDGSGRNGFVIDDNWLPSQDDAYDLGKADKRWRKLFLSGDASVGGALSAASLAVGSISASGDINAPNVYAVNAISGSSLNISGQSTLAGVSAAAITAASLSASGDVTAQTLHVIGQSTLAGVEVQSQLSASSLVVGGTSTLGGLATLNGGASVPAGQTLTIQSGATLDVQGTANYVNLSATGNGTFGGNVVVTGSLTVGGINMSPIASTSPVSTVDGGSATMLTQTLASGDMAKFEVEVIARGGSNAATWKISVAALHDGTNIQAAATELSKEFFGSLGANLDVDIDVSGNNVLVKAKGAASAGTVYWDCQVIKKMVMDSSDGSRKY